jgi:hypothetical protein
MLPLSLGLFVCTVFYFQAQKQLVTQRLGSEAALVTICEHFGDSLPKELPDLWTTCTLPLQAAAQSQGICHGFFVHFVCRQPLLLLELDLL